jgi:hypothetical protein
MQKNLLDKVTFCPTGEMFECFSVESFSADVLSPPLPFLPEDRGDIQTDREEERGSTTKACRYWSVPFHSPFPLRHTKENIEIKEDNPKLFPA